MDLTIPDSARAELASAFFQVAITLGLAILCTWLYRRYRKPYFGWWAVAWFLYVLRLGAIISFIVTEGRQWLYWHQVITGWTALALLWAALVFSRQLRWRPVYAAILCFPPMWSYVAIYRLDHFMLAAGPAVLFLSLATAWTAWAFFRYHRQVGSTAALALAVTFLLWAVHHLDYPLLRYRGVWNPWGYYLDVAFTLAMGAGMLLLVIEDLQGGVRTLSALSSELQDREGKPDVLDALLSRLLSLPAVQGSAMYMVEQGAGRFVAGAGVCADWLERSPHGAVQRIVEQVPAEGAPEIVLDWEPPTGLKSQRLAYVAALPIFRGNAPMGALVIVGAARDPFAALDRPFLVAVGKQVGAALENADLYRRLEGRRAELERLARRMVQQHEEERRRLSRELHDETAQLFSAVKLQLGVAREQATASILPTLDRALALVDEGIQSIRNVTNSLRPSLLDDLGLIPAIRALVHDFADRSGIVGEFVSVDRLPVLSAGAELGIFRAVQEGLANVVRHAHARAFRVGLGVEEGDVVLRIRDDGQGLPDGGNIDAFERRGHMGLAGMRERIHAVGGTLGVGSLPGGGTEIVVRVPPVTEGATQ
jgi:signal transduction histidine kinase